MWSGPDGYLRPDQFLDHLMVIKISDLSYSSIVPQRQNDKRHTLTLNLQLASKGDRKAATYGFPIASSSPYVFEFGPI